MSNSLDPDQAQQSVGPDLGSNSLQRLSADNTIEGKELTSILRNHQKIAARIVTDLYKTIVFE